MGSGGRAAKCLSVKCRSGIFNQEGGLNQNEEMGIEENDKGRYVIAYVCVVEQNGSLVAMKHKYKERRSLNVCCKEKR